MAVQTWVDVQRDARGVARLTINNPAKLNTLNTAVMTDLIAAAEGLCQDRGVRAVVLCSAGERAFIGGADIGEMAALDAGSARTFITTVHRSCDVFRRMPVPVIARIQGWTLGAGLEVAAACDMRVAAEGARFGMPEVRVGLPSGMEAALLPALVGWGRAAELVLTGDIFDARQAYEMGFLQKLVPAADLDAAVEKWIDSILLSGQRAVRLQKKLLRDWERLPLDEAIQAGIRACVESRRTDEPKRMMEAFLNRRKK